MQRMGVLPLLLAVFFATVMQAQVQAPKPDPELKKLGVFVGHWTYEGESKPGPLGPGGKFTGEMTCRMILGGFFLQCRVTDISPAGVGVLEVDGYDPVNKNFSGEMYSDDGTRFSGALTITGNTWTYAGKWAVAGKQYQFKDSVMLAPDSTSATEKAEISADGQTWTPFLKAEWTKVQPAAEK